MLQLLPEETAFYSQLQRDVLNDKVQMSYRKIVKKYGFTSCQTLENFLYRTILGFKLNTIEGISGSIPLVPDIITSTFVHECMLQVIDLNCIYTHKALRILEDLLSERTFRAYQIAIQIKCPTLSCNAIERLNDTCLTSQRFSNYCSDNGLTIVNAQTLNSLRRKYCHTRVIEKFLKCDMLHNNDYLVYNVDETSVTTNKKGKLVVPEGKTALVSEEQMFGHITVVLACNTAGEALRPLMRCFKVHALVSEEYAWLG